MKINSITKIAFASAIAFSATNVSAAIGSGWTTAPANVKAAQDLAKVAKAEFDKSLALVNDPSIRADAGKFSEAAARFENARQQYQKAVVIEKEQIAIALQPKPLVAAPQATPAAPQTVPGPLVQQLTPKAPAATPVAPVHFKEPQNLPDAVAPTAPAAKPVAPVHYKEPQNLPDPVAPKKLFDTPAAPHAAPTQLAPQATPSKSPTFVAPAAPVTPSKLIAQATPSKTPAIVEPVATPAKLTTPAQVVPATPEARAPQAPKAPAVPLPAHAPVAPASTAIVAPAAAPYQAPVGKEVAGSGYKGEILLVADNHHATAADVQIVTADKATTSAKVTAAPTATTGGGAPAANTTVMTNPVSTVVTNLNDEIKRATQAEKDLDSEKADKTYVDTQDGIILNQAKANTTQQVTDASNVLGQHIDDEETRATAAETKLTNEKADKTELTAVKTTADGAGSRSLHNEQVIQQVGQVAYQAYGALQPIADSVTAEETRAKTAEKDLNKQIGDAQDAAVDHADKIGDAANDYTDAAVKVETDRATSAETKLTGELAKKEDHADFVADQTRQDKALSTETTRAQKAEQANQTASLNNGAAIRQVSTQVAAQGAYVQQQTKAVSQNTTAIAANRTAIKRNSDRIDANSKRIDDLKAENKDIRRDMKSIGNNAAAMASLHFDANRDSWALSTGSYNADGAAFAGGLQKSISENVAVTIQASFDGAGNTMIGAGIHGDY